MNAVIDNRNINEECMACGGPVYQHNRLAEYLKCYHCKNDENHPNMHLWCPYLIKSLTGVKVLTCPECGNQRERGRLLPQIPPGVADNWADININSPFDVRLACLRRLKMELEYYVKTGKASIASERKIYRNFIFVSILVALGSFMSVMPFIAWFIQRFPSCDAHMHLSNETNVNTLSLDNIVGTQTSIVSSNNNGQQFSLYPCIYASIICEMIWSVFLIINAIYARTSVVSLFPYSILTHICLWIWFAFPNQYVGAVGCGIVLAFRIYLSTPYRNFRDNHGGRTQQRIRECINICQIWIIAELIEEFDVNTDLSKINPPVGISRYAKIEWYRKSKQELNDINRVYSAAIKFIHKRRTPTRSHLTWYPSENVARVLVRRWETNETDLKKS
jgi:hypothetical protein